jgi:hypothetical protein
MSSSLSLAYAGIATSPQTPPLLPFLITPANLAGAPALPLYFLLISLSDGPKSDLSILWQLKQLFFLANALNAAASTAAFACPANINAVATAAMPTHCDFIPPPQNNLIIFYDNILPAGFRHDDIGCKTRIQADNRAVYIENFRQIPQGTLHHRATLLLVFPDY